MHRGEHAYVLLNLFPYNSGHLLVCPYRHVPLYDEATDEEAREIAALTQTAMRVLRADSRCDGFNIGMNQGAHRGRRRRGAPPPARRAAVGLRRELLPDHRRDEGAAGAARRHLALAARRLARLTRALAPAELATGSSGRAAAR